MSIIFWIIFLAIILLLISVSLFLFKKGKVEKELKCTKRERYEYLASIKPKSLDLGVEYKEEPVPKKIYRTWCTTETEKDCGGRRFDPKVIEKTQLNLPEWEQIIYTDEDIESFLNTEFGKNHPVTQAYHLLNPAYGAARADLFRYLVIYKYGGLYLDMKSCVVGLLPVIPEDKNIWVSTWSTQKHLFKDGEYQNWYIYARKGSPVLKKVIERVVHNIFKVYNDPEYEIDISYDNSSPAKSLVLSVTGPIAYSMVIENSKDKGVHYDNHINSILYYDCGKFGIISNSHYSNQTHSLVLTNINNVKKNSLPAPLIYIISLDKSEDRKKHMDKILKGYNKQYISAVYGKNMTKKQRDQISPNRTREMTPGEVGCFLSHRKCWKKIQYLLENQWVIILEDDVSIGLENWPEYLQNALLELPNKYNLLFLHNSTSYFYNIFGRENGTRDMFPVIEKDSTLGKYTVNSAPRLGTYAYCINPKGSRILLKNTQEMILPIDVQWQLPQVRKELGGTAATKKPLFITKELFESTVQK